MKKEFISQMIIVEDEFEIAQNFIEHLDLSDLLSQTAYITDFDSLSSFLVREIPYRVFWIDINLGNGRESDGLDMISLIKQMCPNSLIIVHSAYENKREKSLTLGADYFFLKEKYEETIAKIRKIIIEFHTSNCSFVNVTKFYAEVADIDDSNGIVKLECYIDDSISYKFFPLERMKASFKGDITINIPLEVEIFEKGTDITLNFRQL